MSTRVVTVRRRVGAVAAVAFSMFCTLMTFGLAMTAGTPAWNAGLGLLLNLAAAVALVWRYRSPLPVLAVSVAGPLLFATDATAALIALYAFAVTASRLQLRVGAVVVYAACSISLTYDAFRRRDYSVLTIGIRTDRGGPAPEWNLPIWLPWVVAGVLVALVLGASALRRTRRSLDQAVASRDIVSAQKADLDAEMALAAERARIARDMHDTLAAGLGRISLLAGGLQVNATDGAERVSNTASLIRHTAHDSLDELKRIIGVLRADDPGYADGGRRSIEGVPDLVQSARESGMRVGLSVDLAPGEVGALTSHVVYRVVQESLTNAERHAGGAPVHVAVQGDPSQGVGVTVRNHLSDGPAFAHGSGTGLTGATEQVRGAGGTLSTVAADGEFVVTAWLPWYS